MTPDIPFARISISPLGYYQEAWSRIKDQYWLFLGICVVGVIVGSLGPMGILMGPMMVGIYLCYRAKARGEEVAFNVLFKGFDRFMEAFIAALIMMATSLVIVLPLVFIMIFGSALGMMGFAAAAPRGAEELAGLGGCAVMGCGMLVLMGISMLVGLIFTFTFPLIADRGLPGLDAVKLSLRAAWANLWPLLGLAIVTFFLSLIGLMFCYVGALLVLPLTMGVHWIAYERVFGMKDGSELPAEIA